jgi:hypothetical protein
MNAQAQTDIVTERVDFAKEPICPRMPAGKGNTGGAPKSINLANITLDLRYVTGYGSGWYERYATRG